MRRCYARDPRHKLWGQPKQESDISYSPNQVGAAATFEDLTPEQEMLKFKESS
jgi:hypothetical protein